MHIFGRIVVSLWDSYTTVKFSFNLWQCQDQQDVHQTDRNALLHLSCKINFVLRKYNIRMQVSAACWQTFLRLVLRNQITLTTCRLKICHFGLSETWHENFTTDFCSDWASAEHELHWIFGHFDCQSSGAAKGKRRFLFNIILCSTFANRSRERIAVLH